MMKRRYTYTVLRYVHDPITGEFINVGLVLFCPAASGVRAILKASTRKTIGRMRDMFPDLDRDAFVSTMRTIERQLGRVAERLANDGLVISDGDASSFAREVLPTDDSSLQWSPAGGGLTDAVEKVFDRLCARFITRYDTKQTARRSDDEIWKPVRQLIAERALMVDLEPKVIVGSDDKIEFQHAWKNGAWHIYEPVSLDLADAEGIQRKAYRWLGQLTSLGQTSEPFEANFIVGAPSDPTLDLAYRRALRILGKPDNVTVYEEADVGELVDRIEDEVRLHNAEDQARYLPPISY
jgi:hypothetical protein